MDIMITWTGWSNTTSVAFTHWGRVTHICVSKLTINGSDNGLSPDRRQAIIWTNAGLLLTGPLGTNFSGILIEILKFSFKKMRLKVSSAKRRPFCPGLNVLSSIRRQFTRLTCWQNVEALISWQLLYFMIRFQINCLNGIKVFDTCCIC